MQEPSVVHNTFVIERSFPKPPEEVFSAFANAASKRRWFAESDSHDIEEYTLDFRVGGAERLQYRFKEGTPFPGTALVNEGRYQDIVPNRRIVFAYTMTLGDRRISASLATVEIVPTEKGTDLIFTEQGAYFEGADGAQMRTEGWGKLLENLGKELAR